MTEIEKLAEEIKEAIASNMVASTRNAIASDWVYDLNITTRKVLEIIEGYKAAASNTVAPVDNIRWVKASERLPEKHGYYFCKIGKLRDKILWTKNKIVLMFNRPGIELEWLEEQTKEVSTNNQK